MDLCCQIILAYVAGILVPHITAHKTDRAATLSNTLLIFPPPFLLASQFAVANSQKCLSLLTPLLAWRGCRQPHPPLIHMVCPTGLHPYQWAAITCAEVNEPPDCAHSWPTGNNKDMIPHCFPASEHGWLCLLDSHSKARGTTTGNWAWVSAVMASVFFLVWHLHLSGLSNPQ